VWTLIDTEKLCPINLTPELQEGYEFDPKLEMEYAPRKIVLLGEEQVEDQFRVRKFQIDSNKHMNNVEYVRYAMDTLPEDAAFRELRVEYKKAARYGDEVTVAVIRTEGKHQVVLRDCEGAVYAVVEFTLEGIIV
ncbi:MAG: acyl-[acyl-carrier-protein] thioesterase, partial [Lachnospiraceae bacterium]|nr:acyl-[acyl-carrier-protein] thioesterase [Lachnospiraceae bacterium]